MATIMEEEDPIIMGGPMAMGARMTTTMTVSMAMADSAASVIAPISWQMTAGITAIPIMEVAPMAAMTGTATMMPPSMTSGSRIFSTIALAC